MKQDRHKLRRIVGVRGYEGKTRQTVTQPMASFNALSRSRTRAENEESKVLIKILFEDSFLPDLM